MTPTLKEQLDKKIEELIKDESYSDGTFHSEDTVYQMNKPISWHNQQIIEELTAVVESTGCIGIFTPVSPNEAKGYCCPRHYGQIDIISKLKSFLPTQDTTEKHYQSNN